MSKKNILYIHRTQGKGVEGVHIAGIAGGLRAAGNDVEIISPADLGPSKKAPNGFKTLSKFIPEILFEIMEIAYNLTAYKKARKITLAKKIDFIYERFAFFSWTGALLSKIYNIPLFLEINYTTHTPLVRKRTKLLLPLARHIERKILTRASAIFVVSSFLKKQLMEMGVSEKKIYLTVNAVDGGIFQSIPHDAEIRAKYNLNGATVIGYVGGFYPWHGIDLLLQAVKNIECEYGNLSILLVGDGPVKNQLKNQYAKLRMHSKMIMPGEVEHKDLPKYLAAMDICILPDSNEYCSPVKILEYMAMGKPVLAPNLGNVKDIISDRVNGVLFKAGDCADMEKTIKLILENKELRADISSSARKEIFKYHLWSNNVEKILCAYAKAADNNDR